MVRRSGDLPVVGVVGAGQLARMLQQAAVPLGTSLRVLAERADDAAALVCPDVEIGAPDDLEALRRFAAGCDVVTVDHEWVPAAHLEALAAEGVRLRPGPQALAVASDKTVLRRRLADLGVAQPRHEVVQGRAGVADALTRLGPTVVVKPPRGGYDGRGVFVLDDPAGVPDALADAELLVEELVGLRREVAAVVARSPWGQVACYPVVETVQRDGILVESVTPPPGLGEGLADEATRTAVRLADVLDVVGLLAVEQFETDQGLLVNEIAVRPHNSAHWTLDGARTSQFEQHLRAVLDLPLGDPSAVAPVVVTANLLGGADAGSDGVDAHRRLHHALAAEPGARVHLYGKRPRPGRKLGHVTVPDDDVDRARHWAARAVAVLRDGTDPDGVVPTTGEPPAGTAT